MVSPEKSLQNKYNMVALGPASKHKKLNKYKIQIEKVQAAKAVVRIEKYMLVPAHCVIDNDRNDESKKSTQKHEFEKVISLFKYI